MVNIKKWSILFVCFMVCLAAGCGNVPDEKAVSDKTGKIQEVEESPVFLLVKENVRSEHAAYDAGREEKGEVMSVEVSFTEYGYDGRGNKTKETAYDFEGRVSSSKTFEYDEHSHCIKESFYDNNGALVSESEFKYDDNGNQVENIILWENYHTTCEYDENGNQVCWNSYDENGKVMDSCTTEYNEQGDETRKTMRDDDGRVYYELVFEYDYHNDGTSVDIKEYGYDNVLTNMTHNEYDRNDNLIQQDYYDTDGNLVESSEISYDEHNNQTRQVWKDAENYQVEAVEYSYDYDEENRLVSLASLNPSGDVYHWTNYEYDEAGNKVKVTERFLEQNEMFTNETKYEYVRLEDYQNQKK